MSRHPDNAASWHRTFHRTMTQAVGPKHPDAVAGDFADATYTYLGDAVRAGLLLQAMEGDRYPAVRYLAARALARVMGDPIARQARAFDATGAAPAREHALAALRAALPRAALHPPDPQRLARLRAEVRQVDIDIGECA